MSQQNLELVRRFLAAFARGDFETASSSYSPDAEWVAAEDEPDRSTYRGVTGLREFVASAAEPWLDRFENVMQFEDFVDCGDWVVAPWTAQVRGRGSGMPVDLSETYALRVRGTQIVRVEEYRTREQALEAVERP